MPHVDQEDDAGANGGVPHFVLERVVEERRTPLDPAPDREASTRRVFISASSCRRSSGRTRTAATAAATTAAAVDAATAQRTSLRQHVRQPNAHVRNATRDTLRVRCTARRGERAAHAFRARHEEREVHAQAMIRRPTVRPQVRSLRQSC